MEGVKCILLKSWFIEHEYKLYFYHTLSHGEKGAGYLNCFVDNKTYLNLLTGIRVALRTGTGLLLLLLFPRFKFIPTPGIFMLATPGKLRLTLMFCCWCWCGVDDVVVVVVVVEGGGWWPDILPDIAWYARKLWKPKHEFQT